MKKIYLAGGCFWGVEEYFSRIDGVIKTDVGYANSDIPHPSYEQVCTGTTNAAETVMIDYNEEIISLGEILDKYFAVVDPTSVNKQGGDVGTQYRTGIYYVDSVDKSTADEYITEKQKEYDKKIVVEVQELRNYYSAEEYHQDYLKKNPSGYCHIKL